jgi:hypothetical protein
MIATGAAAAAEGLDGITIFDSCRVTIMTSTDSKMWIFSLMNFIVNFPQCTYP